MANNKTRHPSDRSNTSVNNRPGLTEKREMEYFWSVVLTTDKRSVTWVVNNESTEDEDIDLVHTLFLKSAVLGANAVSGESNIVALQSAGEDGKTQKGAIAHLARGQNPMTPLDLTIPGKIGCTFTLVEGSGPVTIAGNHLLEFEKDELMDDTQTEDFTTTDEEENDNDLELVEDVVESEEEAKDKKSAKRKATPKTTKHKQKAKMDVEDDQSEEDEEEDDDDDDEDYEENVKAKKSKKAKMVGKKSEKAAKTKLDKDSGKKGLKNVKK